MDVSKLDTKELFVLDANVLFWLYGGYSPGPADKDYVVAQEFSNFIAKLLQNGNPLGASVGNVQEVLNVIERTEFRLYQHAGGALQQKKAFRADPTQRRNVQKKVQATYNAICGACELFDVMLRQTELGQFVSDYTTHAYEPIDYFVAADVVANGRLNYITNDPDFQKDTRLNVYTML